MINIAIFYHAYNFTNYNNSVITRTNSPSELNSLEKFKVLLTGVKNPKPKNNSKPNQIYHNLKLHNDKTISFWSIPKNNSKGTVILFHGFSSSKSSLIPYSNYFHELGYSTVLVDFRGCGDSEGYNTTIGYNESNDVSLIYNFIRSNGENNIVLFGSSMGAVAILRAIHTNNISPDKIILQCPFESLDIAIKNRFTIMNIPTFLFSDLLLIWGGMINNFNPYEHNSIDYSRSINCPTLILYGEKDKRVKKSEILNIYKNLKTKNKTLKIFKNVGHDGFIDKSNILYWYNNIDIFLK